MKILQVISSFPPAYSYGGPAKVVYGISKELVKNGHDVTVFTTDVFDANSRYKCKKNPILMEGIKVYYFKNVNNALAHQNFPIAPQMVHKLHKDIKTYDIVHLHEHRSFQAVISHYFAMKYNIPYILQTHGAVLEILEKKSLKRFYDILFGYHIIKDAKRLIALTSTESEQYKTLKIEENKIAIIPNAVDLLEYQQLPQKGIFRKTYHIHDNEKIVLYLGRIHKIKGIDLLVEAFADLIKVLENIKLIIVGPDGGFLSKVQKQIRKLGISDNIIFTGPLYDYNKLVAYQDADVYVLTSYFEAFPLTVLEACACGTPVVITEQCNIGDFIRNQAGFVIGCNPIMLKNQLYTLLVNDKLREQFGMQARELIKTQFTWKTIVHQFEDIYSEVQQS